MDLQIPELTEQEKKSCKEIGMDEDYLILTKLLDRNNVRDKTEFDGSTEHVYISKDVSGRYYCHLCVAYKSVFAYVDTIENASEICKVMNNLKGSE